MTKRQKLTRWWHGGAPGLRVGDRLRPASCLSALPFTYQMAEYETDPERVYITPDKVQARAYAAKWRSPETGPTVFGDLYNVRPSAPIEPDPDFAEGVSYTCLSAVITGVAERGVRMTSSLLIAGNRYITWDGGGAMYDTAGYMLPSPQMVALEIHAEDLRGLGVAPDYDAAEPFVRAILAGRSRNAPRSAQRQ